MSGFTAAVRSSLLVLGVVCGLANAAPPKLTRGPYLQLATPTSIVVRWRTEEPSDSLVRFGTNLSALTSSAGAAGVTKEHIVELKSLQPDTRYFYSIGTTNWILAGGDASHAFTTPPPVGAAKPTRVWVLGDSGTKNADARAVRDAYQRFSGARGEDLWLMLGDNAYRSGLDEEYQAALFTMYPEMLRRAVLWPTLGNHDARSVNTTNQTGPYYDVFTLPTLGQAGGLPSGTEAYYSFNYANIHFICLNSNHNDRSSSGPMLTWLRRDLLVNTNHWIVAFWHHAPFSRGAHDSDDDKNTEMREMRENALPLLEEGGVDLVLCGHSHSYERSFFLSGHYGKSATLTPAMKRNPGDGRVTDTSLYFKSRHTPMARGGTIYVVAGSSGQTSGGKLDHPAMRVSFNLLGSLVLDFNGTRLDATFIDDKAAVRDSFTIIKEAR